MILLVSKKQTHQDAHFQVRAAYDTRSALENSEFLARIFWVPAQQFRLKVRNLLLYFNASLQQVRALF